MEAQGTSDGIQNPYGSIITDKLIPDWNYLSIKGRKKVVFEIKRLIVRIGKGDKGKKGGNSYEHNNSINKAFRTIKKQNRKFKIQIKALKMSNPDKYDGSDYNEVKLVGSGDTFGGNNSNKKGKITND